MKRSGSSVATAPSPWIGGRRWDLSWLVGSAAVVPGLMLLVWGGVSSDLLNLLVTLMVGGPHVFATFVTTYLDPAYRRRHGWALAAVALTVPAIVVYLTTHHFQILMSGFIFAASLHVLQQNAYLAGLYRERRGKVEPAWSRFLDCAVMFLSFYPIASHKLIHGEFQLGEIVILIPDIVRSEWTFRAVTAAFGIAVLLWLLKTAVEVRSGAINWPKTLLIALTSSIAFLVPAAAAGSRLELAFQTVNVWHSIQYLAIVWLVLALRKREGRRTARLIEAISGRGAASWRYYGVCILFTSMLLGIILLLHRTDPLGLTTPQYYYMAVLSVLFIHYALDGYFFFFAGRSGADAEKIPYALPAASGSGEAR